MKKLLIALIVIATVFAGCQKDFESISEIPQKQMADSAGADKLSKQLDGCWSLVLQTVKYYNGNTEVYQSTRSFSDILLTFNDLRKMMTVSVAGINSIKIPYTIYVVNNKSYIITAFEGDIDTAEISLLSESKLQFAADLEGEPLHYPSGDTTALAEKGVSIQEYRRVK